MTPKQKELLAVTAVGAGLALILREVPLINRLGIVGGTLLYVGGYMARDQRPAGGWPMLQSHSEG